MRQNNIFIVIINILSAYGLYGVNLAIGLIAAPILLKGLGNNAYGLMNSAMSSWQYLALLSLGTNTIVLRHIPKVIATQESGEPEKTISTFLVFNIFVTISGGLLVLSVTPLLNRYLNISPELIKISKVSIIVLGFYAINNFFASYLGTVLAGNKKLFINNSINALQGVSIAISSIYLVTIGMGLRTICVAMLFLGIFFTLFRFLYIRAKFSGISIKQFDNQLFLKLLKPGLVILLLGIGSTSIYQSGNIIIGTFISVGAVAIYAVTRKLLDATIGVVIQFSDVLVPYIAEAQALNGGSGTRSYNRGLFKITLFISSIVLFGMLFYGKWLISLWLGPDRFIGWNIWVVLCIWMFLRAITQPGAVVIIAVGKQNYLAIIVLIEAILSIAFGVVLVGNYGVLGVSTAGLVSTILTGAWFIPWYAVRITKDTIHGIIKYAILPCIYAITPALAWQLLLRGNLISTIQISKIVEIIVTGLLIILGAWQLGLGQNERDRITKIIKFKRANKKL